MKKIIFLIVVLISCNSFLFAQKNYFEFDGKVNTPYSGKVYLLCAGSFRYSNREECSFYPKDSANIINGSFSFKGTIQYPHFVMLKINDAFSQLFFLQKGNQFVKIDSFKSNIKLNITGSPANDEYTHEYLKLMQKSDAETDAWVGHMQDARRLYGNKIPDSIEIANDDEKKKILDERDSLFLSYVRNNNNSFVSLWILTYRFDVNGYSPIYDLYFKTLSDKIRNSYTGQILYKRLTISKQNVAMGKHFPQINLIDSNNHKIILDTSILKAKFILVDFWFNRCTPCLRQFSELKNIVSEYKPTEFEIIGISTDNKEDEDNWKLVMRKQRLNWKNYLDVNGIEANRLNVFRYPTNFLLNNKGEIVQKDIPPFELQKLLKQNLR